MVPDLFTPSCFLCGIPQILLPLTFARNLMQLAPRAKGLRVLLSGLCSFPVALFVSFGLLFTCARGQFNLHCISGWLRLLLGRGVLFHVQGLAVHPMLVSRTYFTLPHGFLAFHNVIYMDCILSYLLHTFSYSNPFALLHSHDRAVPILAGVTLFAGRQPLTIQTQLDLLLLSLPRYASTRVRIIH